MDTVKTINKARVVTPNQLKSLRQEVPESWLKVAGILKGKKKINAMAYQKLIRKGWAKRAAKLKKLSK